MKGGKERENERTKRRRSKEREVRERERCRRREDSVTAFRRLEEFAGKKWRQENEEEE